MSGQIYARGLRSKGSGRIHSQRHVEYDTWAECASCDRHAEGLASRGSRPKATDQLSILGWRWQHHIGWTCPACLLDRAAGQESKEKK